MELFKNATFRKYKSVKRDIPKITGKKLQIQPMVWKLPSL